MINFAILFRKIRSTLPLLALMIVPHLHAQPNFALKQMNISGLTEPMQLTHAGDGSGRTFIAERSGIIKVFDVNLAALGTYLDLSADVSVDGEGGLLSIVFHPLFKTNRCLYVHYTDKAGHVIVRRYIASASGVNIMDDAAPVNILSIDHPVQNHYGGQIHFGQDGNMYLSVGDGGGGNDVSNNAQNLASPLGKILRFTAGTTAETTITIPEDNPFPSDLTLPRSLVYAIGLRNPFRWSFDSQTGDVWIGDVGQGTQEEIDFCSFTQLRGANFAWRCFEGSVRNPEYNKPAYATECAGYPNFLPRYSYGRDEGRSVVGGVVYRGTKFPSLTGYYFGSDFYTGNFHVIGPSSSNGRVSAVVPNVKMYISNFGESENGDLYAVAMTEGRIYLIGEPGPLPVVLADFNARPSGEGNVLTWTTASEENFDRFELEYSIDSRNFQKIGSIRGVSGGRTYTMTHKADPSHNAYYRLRMIDLDESFTYSKIVAVKSGDIAGFVNPSVITSGVMSMHVDPSYHSLEIINASGQVMLKSNLQGKNGRIDLPIGQVASGIYVVRLEGDQLSQQQKVVIVK